MPIKFGRYFPVLSCLFCMTFLQACDSTPPLPACEDSIGCVTVKPGEPAKIGVLQDLSGSSSLVGKEQLKAVQLAVSELVGGFMGHPVEVFAVDGRCSAEGASVAALKLLADPQLLGIVGTTCSSGAVAVVEKVSEAGVVMLSGTNGASSLTTFGNGKGDDWQPGYYRICDNDKIRGEAAAFYAFNELRIRQAATIDDGDAYTSGYTKMFRVAFKRLGGEIVFEGRINKMDKNMGPILNALEESGASTIFFTLFQPEALPLLQQLSEIRELADIPLFSGGLFTDDLIKSLKNAGKELYFIGPELRRVKLIKELSEKYKLAYGTKPLSFHMSYAYDAANMLFDALSEATQRSTDGTILIGRQALRNALYAFSGEGTTGRLKCDEYGDCADPKAVIMQVTDYTHGLEGVKNNVVYVYSEENRDPNRKEQ